MSKASTDIKELQRILGRLARLDGRVVATTSGPVMVWPLHDWARAPGTEGRPGGRSNRRSGAGEQEPAAVIDACRSHGAPTVAALMAALVHVRPPQPLSADMLARAQRDIRRLRAAKDWLSTVRQAPRLFASFGPLDAGWLTARQEQLDRCARALQAAEVRPRGTEAPEDWFAVVLDLIGALSGSRVRADLEHLLLRCERIGGRRRQLARRALSRLCAHVRERDTTDEYARAILQIWSRPSRRLRRRLRSIIARALALPVADTHAVQTGDEPGDRTSSRPAEPAHTWRPDTRPEEVVRQFGEYLLGTIAPTRSPVHREYTRRVLAHYGWLFRAAATPALSAERLGLLDRRRAESVELAGLDLTIGEVLRLLGMRGDYPLATIRRLLRAGLSPTEVIAAGDLGFLRAASQLAEKPAELAAYCAWMTRLSPHYQRLGVTFELDAEHFQSLYRATGRGQNQALAVLAHCLVSHHQQLSPATVARQVTELDATLGLFQRVPAMASELVSAISDSAPGLGARTHAGFASWLNTDHLLDRYLHLLRLIGEPVEVSRALLKDYQRQQRLAGERRFLANLSAPSAHQLRRIQALDGAALATPDRTRRWLATRIPELAARAYRRKLDELLNRLVRDICGAKVPTLTPAWRDAVRFFLTAEDNRELLAHLLRFAASQPGASYRSVGTENRAWLARAQDRMETGAWQASYRRSLTFGDAHYTIAIEDDPLEVLRMGIPFGTCLALQSGENAASTVINAMDANKRVLYVRDDRGTIVGRKLCAVSKNWQLLGYRVYWTGGESGARGARARVRAACDDLCRQLARACRLPLVAWGEPAQLHAGFWYDDGACAFAPAPLDVGSAGDASDGRDTVTDAHTDAALIARYCAALGQPTPTETCDELVREARGHDARARGDVEAAIDCLQRDTGMAALMLGDWIVDSLGLAEARRRAHGDEHLIDPLLRHIERSSPERAITAGGEYTRALWSVSESVRTIADRAPRSASVVAAFIAAAERSRQIAEYDDHGLEHQTMWRVPGWLSAVSIDEVLSFADRLEPLWELVVAEDEGCVACRSAAEERLLASALASYASAPAPSVVLKCLTARRRTLLARRVALHIAARFTLDSRAPASAIDLFDRYAQEPRPVPAAARALKRLLKAQPELVDEPDSYAALLRHSARPEPPAGRRGADAGWHAGLQGGLPNPARKPFAALGPLLLHLPQLREHLQQWADLGVPKNGWSIEPWELYFHRSGDSPWRETLRQALHEGADAERAAYWLAVLGEVDVLVAHRAVQSRRHRGRFDKPVRTARAVAAQLQLRSAPLTESLGLDFHNLSTEHVVTREHLSAAWRVIRDAMTQPAPERSSSERSSSERLLTYAARVLYHGTSRAEMDMFLAQVMAALQDPSRLVPGPVLRLVGWVLSAGTTYGAPRVKRAWIAHLWHVQEIRAELCQALGRTFEHELANDFAAVRRAEPEMSLSGLYGAWLKAQLDRTEDPSIEMDGPEQARAVAREALDYLSAEQWAKLYLSLPDCATAAAFLDVLGDSPARPAIQGAAAEIEANDWDRLAPILRGWLNACGEPSDSTDAERAQGSD